MPNILNKLAFLVFCPSTEFWERGGWVWDCKKGVSMKWKGSILYTYICVICFPCVVCFFFS